MSITKPGRGEVLLALTASRLFRPFLYPPFIDRIGLKGGERVLDFGAGWGDSSYYIAKRLGSEGKVILLDVSEEWQRVAKKRLREFDNVEFIHSDIASAGLRDQSFDVIVVSYVLHDIDESERGPIVRELARVLKPGGIIQLREPTARSHGMPVDEIRGLMSGVGLKEVAATMKRKRFEARYRKS